MRTFAAMSTFWKIFFSSILASLLLFVASIVWYVASGATTTTDVRITYAYIPVALGFYGTVLVVHILLYRLGRSRPLFRKLHTLIAAVTAVALVLLTLLASIGVIGVANQ